MRTVSKKSNNHDKWFSLENFKGEVWKSIEGFESCYAVSNYGRVKSLSRTTPCIGRDGISTYIVVKSKIKHFSDNGHGYKCVNLYKDNKGTRKYIHILVAKAFIPNPLGLPTVNHKDEDKSNNTVENLEWCSYKYNNLYGTVKARAHKTYNDNENNRAIDMYDKNGNFLKHYENAYHVERDGLNRRGVYNVCYGRAKTYKGCVFAFSEDGFHPVIYDKHPKGQKKEVVVTDTNGEVVKIYSSIKQAEKDNGLKRNYLYTATYASSRKAFINNLYFEIKKYE